MTPFRMTKWRHTIFCLRWRLKSKEHITITCKTILKESGCWCVYQVLSGLFGCIRNESKWQVGTPPSYVGFVQKEKKCFTYNKRRMIFWYGYDECARMRGLYTVENKEYEKIKRITWRDRYRDKYVKLYHLDKRANRCYFPHWQLSGHLAKSKELSKQIKYKGTPTEEQKTVLEKIWDKRTWLIVMKTWRGKSHSIMWIAAKFQEPVLIACHNTGTLAEMKTKLKEFCNYKVWLYYWKKKELGEITITTHASLTQSYDVFKWKFGILIVDECDYNLSSKMIEAICLGDFDWLFWFTATTERKEINEEDMCKIFWDIVKLEWQENNGYNLIPEITRVNYTTNDFYSFESWHELKEQLVSSPKRIAKQINFVINEYNEKKFKYWVILLERKEQECNLYYNILKSRIPTIMINWDTKTEDDEKWLEFIKKEWKGIIVWTVGKIWRGKDIPFLDGVFLFFPSKFDSNVIQAVGRGLRNSEWKTWCKLYDWSDLPILVKQSQERLRIYKKEYTKDVVINDFNIS